MIKKKYKVLEKHRDKAGITLVIRIKKVKVRKWWQRNKIFSVRDITIWTTLNSELIKRNDFNPPRDWLVINPNFRHYWKDCKNMGPVSILSDNKLLEIAKSNLIV